MGKEMERKGKESELEAVEISVGPFSSSPATDVPKLQEFSLIPRWAFAHWKRNGCWQSARDLWEVSRQISPSTLQGHKKSHVRCVWLPDRSSRKLESPT